ncbi:hypothetical protein ACO0LF_17140 [Undibacterium sp. Di27W]
MELFPTVEQIHRIIFGYKVEGQDFIAVMLHGEVIHPIPLNADNVKWVSSLKQQHCIRVFGQNNRILDSQLKQLWDRLQIQAYGELPCD